MSDLATGSYWEDRQDLLYYRYVGFILRCISAEARSLLDVGTGNCPYLEWFDWIAVRTSIDLHHPYASDRVTGIKDDIFAHRFTDTFDVVTCLQVLEHLPNPAPFARKLLTLGKTLVVSVPFNWPAGKVEDHVQDPVDLGKLQGWFDRNPNYSIVVSEPLMRSCHERLICIYDRDPGRVYDDSDHHGRRLRAITAITTRPVSAA